jgi:hypothetical protein
MAEKRETLERGPEDRIAQAEQLGREAAGYWQTTARGLFALPNATILSLSSAVLYATALAEQAYQRVELLTERIGGEITREIGGDRRSAALPESERARRQPTA